MDTLATQTDGRQVGILGGGQLGCMLADAALALGLSPLLFAEESSPAAALFPDRVVRGRVRATPEDELALRGFFGRVGMVAFENEFLDCSLLERASLGTGAVFGPGLGAIRELQDKLRQKELLVELGLPTARFTRIEPGTDPAAGVERAFDELGGSPVFKWSRMGYDGKGVCLAEGSAEGRGRAAEFCRVSLDRGVTVYAERRIEFRRELALVASLSSAGELAAYPLVLSEQQDGICKRVLGPAVGLGAPEALERQARGHALELARALGLTGTFAIELFETPEGQLSINEIAPRVHNSGHCTQESAASSQFENHWRALLGMPLGDTAARGYFGMLNLLGPEGLDVELPPRRERLPFPAPDSPLRLHWYAKTAVRPRRKVGHVNGVVATRAGLAALEASFAEYDARWRASLAEIPQGPQ